MLENYKAKSLYTVCNILQSVCTEKEASNTPTSLQTRREKETENSVEFAYLEVYRALVPHSCTSAICPAGSARPRVCRWRWAGLCVCVVLQLIDSWLFLLLSANSNEVTKSH